MHNWMMLREVSEIASQKQGFKSLSNSANRIGKKCLGFVSSLISLSSFQAKTGALNLWQQEQATGRSKGFSPAMKCVMFKSPATSVFVS